MFPAGSSPPGASSGSSTSRTSPAARQRARRSAGRLKSSAKRVPERVWGHRRRTSASSCRRSSPATALRLCCRETRSRCRTPRYSEQLAKDVQLLLLEFGIVSRLCRYAKGETKVVITNRRDARLFARNVGFLGAKQAKLDRELAQVPRESRALAATTSRRRRLHPFRRGGSWRTGRLAPPQCRSHRALGAARPRDPRAHRVTRGEGVVEPLVTGDYYYAEVSPSTTRASSLCTPCASTR